MSALSSIIKSIRTKRLRIVWTYPMSFTTISSCILPKDDILPCRIFIAIYIIFVSMFFIPVIEVFFLSSITIMAINSLSSIT